MDLAGASWIGLLALGAGHGINPAMGWLFAVALGLQRGRRAAVWAALTPLALGHALAIAFAVSAALLAGLILPLEALEWGIAVLLVGLGAYRLVRSRHIRYGGMRVGARELTVWSFLMATAHGAGLMVLPLLLGDGPAAEQVHHLAAASVMGAGGIEWNGVVAAMVHTAGYLLVTAVIAVVVYERVGTRFLRKAWVNLDLIWAMALIVAGAATLVL